MTALHRTARRTRGAHGFTLLELMVALAVIATAFTALLGLHVRNLKLAARDQAYTQALLLSRSMITETELGPYPEVGIAQGDFEDRWPGLYTGFKWERVVSDFGVLAVRQVTIRVFPDAAASAVDALSLLEAPTVCRSASARAA